MSKGDQVETEEAREQEEKSEAKTTVTMEPLRVRAVGHSELFEGGCLLERVEDRRGNTEGESEKQGQRKTHENREESNPQVFTQVLPELERVLDRFQVEEESTSRDISDHSQKHHAQSHTSRVKRRCL